MSPFTPRLEPEAARFLSSTCRAVAVVAAVFCVAVSTLLIANAVQLAAVKPLDNPALEAARERYRAAPDNDELAWEVRALDLMARRAYFTRQWQLRTGAYLLLAGAAVLAACLRALAVLGRRLPEPAALEEASPMEPRTLRWGFLGVGILLVAAALTAALLSSGVYRREFPLARVALAGRELPAETPASQAAADDPTSPAEAASARPPAGGPGLTGTDPEPATTEEHLRNWPQFRGPGGNATAAPQDPPTRWDGPSGQNILWRAEVPLPGFGSPVVWDRRVFLSGADRRAQEIYCWDAVTGELAWRRKIEAVPRTPSTPPRVTADTGYAASTMAVNATAAFAIFATGDLAAVDFDGNLLWARNLGLPEHMYGYASSLALYGGSVIVQFDQTSGGRLLAVDAATGETRWQVPRRVQPSWASPAVVRSGDRTLLLVNGSPILAAYDPADGRQLWQVDGMLGEIAPSPAYADGRVFAGNQLLNLIAVDAASGQMIWETYDDLPDVASPLVAGELLITAASYGVVTCLEAATGDLVWRQEFDTGFYASPILAGGRIYLLDRSGVMRILAAGREPRLIASPAIGEAADATPAFREGRIYIRGERHLFCIGDGDG